MFEELDLVKIESWSVAHMDSDANVMIRVSHDAQNGSAITSGGKTLVDALQNLAIAIQKTQSKDEFWKLPLISDRL